MGVFSLLQRPKLWSIVDFEKRKVPNYYREVKNNLTGFKKLAG
jgi:hypothetical protein